MVLLCYCSILNDSQPAKTTTSRESVRIGVTKRQGIRKEDKEKWITKEEG